MPTHHPSEELLIDYAAGAAREPVALLVATHLALCPECRAAVARLEALGGALFQDAAPEPLAADALAQALSSLDAAPEPPAGAATGAASAPEAALDLRVPRPLRDYLGDLDRAAWRRRGPIAEAAVLADFPGFKTRVLRIPGGTAIPQHTHEGSEWTLVLAGGFSDSQGHYLRGDVADADAAVEHRPVADAGEECICLAVTDAPLRFTGPMGRVLNLFTRS